MVKVYDLCQREGSAGHRRLFACRSPRADPFRSARGAEGKLMSIKNARLGFARIIEHPGKALQALANRHG